jgi:hypothetical protein
MLANFLFRIRQYASDHRGKLIKVAIVVMGALILAWLIIYAMERFQEWGYDKGIKALDEKVLHYEAEAKAREAEAQILKNALQLRYAQLKAIQETVRTAEINLQNARHQSGQLKVIYEKTRDDSNIPVDISHCGACEELGLAGHPCK